MANPSKNRPWKVEMRADTLDRWFTLSAYRDQDEAEAQAELARKRAPQTAFRVEKLETH